MQIHNDEIEQSETLNDNDGLLDEDKLFEEAFASVTEGRELKSEEPIKEAQPEEEVKEEAKDSEPAQEPDPNSWLESLPEDVRANVQTLVEEHAHLQQNYKSVYNRLAPTQRRLAELERRIKEQQYPQTREPAPGNASEKSPEQIERDEEWERIKESDPVLAEAFEKKLKKQQEQFDKLIEERLRPYQERSYNDDLDRETQALLQVVPNAVEVFSHPSYMGWLEAQSESVQRLNKSPRHEDAIALLKLYDADISRYQASQQPPPQAQPQVNQEAAKVQQRREDKLKNPVPQSGARTAPKQEEMDETKLFNEFFKKELAEQSRSHGIKY